MFKSEYFKIGPFEGVTLAKADSEMGLSFVPECGATITSLKLLVNDSVKSILDPISSELELTNNDSYKNVWLAPFPNRVAGGTYAFEGKQFQLPKNEDGKNALHGFIYNKKFEVVSIETTDDKAVMELVYEYHANLSGYPFPFRCNLKYILKEDSFSTKIELVNTADSEIPVGLGWHPYFSFQTGIDGLELQLPRITSFKLDSDGLPINEKESFDLFQSKSAIDKTELDHCFITHDQEVSTRLYEADMELELWQNEPYKFLQVYTPPHRNSIAIEPMTCAVDSFNNELGLTILKPGEAISSICGLTLRHKPLVKQEL